ncbi:MAG: HlyD family efflux transporter periplasmic adaptor subunit [Zymomonas mobilis subsp. pomaceae]|uniref:Type I secretion membrane fusion protein, HlyD family n=1 Tax=Zymomonas mobilis subsp. pomaceae (strain ATCC 29192 / DSM 22645 / JCM 10191 / CCUG 17912 / NBRC 13757 / NCIMB 11200 / NRRL B-4491 / Barker I) TaxID=579138 RepID=F8ESP1_ZYMMT|nr:HlyD family efflux transporter periplasmic adaptor subunit [Zymomonas mobilis]AEI37816.1 type I secretion membrane fusion protein, HlyD family [Zymomonas mobilis subsp. pomaceae ATCC 29192]MDX5949183.1 HlyD family efflux transporter periplasmic adaptor subunit [Zymomonas mobilis subsp. pomaceae]GEB89819.1 HlyD family type I secretion periplasmic adaptor subunit [Zymomonas mobilis subsp. pomaceae]
MADSPSYTGIEPLAHHSLLRMPTRIIWIIAALLVSFFLWAAFSTLDEVSTGTGKVVPSSHEQTIQSLEGGILVDLKVKEGDIVKAGQMLAQLDRTRTQSSVDETAARAIAAEATAARLRAEVNNMPLSFPVEVKAYPALIRSETALYNSRRTSLATGLSDLHRQLTLIKNELAMTEPLVAKGAASDVEVLRLQRQISEIQTRADDMQSQYMVKAREDLEKAEAEAKAQESVTRGRSDMLDRLTFSSPMRGIVKDIEVTTKGGVIPPNGRLMTIVPMDEQLLVEARISPRDIAFIHPGQSAMVKLSAYDYSIYGGLPAKVTVISPDTVQDDVRRDTYYYRVWVRTDSDHLTNKSGHSFPIVPGMVATIDIHTGSKTILQYLIKPLNRAKEALRER